MNEQNMETKRNKFFTPVEEGQELLIEVEGFGEKGDAFGRLNGYVVFIQEASDLTVGTQVKVVVAKAMKSMAFAKFVELG